MTGPYQTWPSGAIGAAVAVTGPGEARLRMNVARTAPAPFTGGTGCP